MNQEQAKKLLDKYQTTLENFQMLLRQSFKLSSRADVQIIPEMLNCLEAIADNKPYTPIEIKGGMSSMDSSSLPNDPHEAIKHLAHAAIFDKMLDFQKKSPATMKPDSMNSMFKTMEDFSKKIKVTTPKPPETPKVIFYKAQNGELAVKFPTKELASKFLEKLGGQQRFSANDPFNPEKKAPMIYSDNPTTLYFPAYTAQNGEFTAAFPSETMKNNFVELAISNPKYNKFSDRLVEPEQTPVINPGGNALYFKSDSFHKPRGNLQLELTNKMKKEPEMNIRSRGPGK